MTKSLIIGGKLIETDDIREIINPFDNSIVDLVSFGNFEIMNNAIDIAHKSFEVTKKLTSYQRSNICLSIVQKIKERKQELAKSITLESGKPLMYSIGEVERCMDTFTIAGDEAKRRVGEYFSLDSVSRGFNRDAITQKFPDGVIAGITPFNFPLNLVAHKIAPAIAVGAPFIIKPSSKTPITALLLGEIIIETEWPKEAINIIPCSAKVASKTLVVDHRVKILTFTGSAEVGWTLKQSCGKKKILLELGGNAGVIIHKDAPIDYSVERCTMGSFAYSGQVCISIQRIYVHEDVYDEFISKFKDLSLSLKIGNPLDPEISFSCMVDKPNVLRINDWIQESIKSGSKLLFGGKVKGLICYPTALTNVSKNDKLNILEAFGPVIVIEKYKNFDNALIRINDSNFGLQAGVFTNDINLIMKSYQELNVGGVIINDVPTFRVDQMPYGGNKDSGFGREGIKYTMEEYCSVKLLVLNQSMK